MQTHPLHQVSPLELHPVAKTTLGSTNELRACVEHVNEEELLMLAILWPCLPEISVFGFVRTFPDKTNNGASLLSNYDGKYF